MIKNLVDFLRKPASTSAELAEKLAEIEKAAPAAKSQAMTLAAERQSKLLTSSDAELEKLEKRIADARREADRLEAAREHISARYDETVRAEARAALDHEKTEAENLTRAMTERIRREYPVLAGSLVDLIEALDDAEGQVRALNEKLVSAGRGTEALPEIESRAIRFKAVATREMFRICTTSLPPALDFPGFGEAAVRADLDGLVL